MKTTLTFIPALVLSLIAGPSILTAKPVPAPAPAASPSALAEIAKELRPTASVLARQSIALMTSIRQTLADARNTESADKAAETLKNMQESVRHFQQSCSAVSNSEWKKFEDEQKRMKETAEKLIQDCKKEGSRLVETRYYGSAALKELLEDSEEFRLFIQPNEPESEN